MRSIPTGRLKQAAAKAPREVEYSAPYAARELARAAIREQASMPALQDMVEKGVRWGGGAGSLISMARGKPLAAGGLSLLANAPKLIEHGRASVRGYKALEEMGALSPKELEKARGALKHLGAREGGLAWARGISNAAVSQPELGALIPVLPLFPTIARIRSREAENKVLSKGPQFSEKQTEELKKILGTSVSVHAGKAGLSSDHAGYVRPNSRGPLLPHWGDLLSAGKLRSGSVSQSKKLREEGGVILPGKVKKAFQQTEQKKPSKFKDFAKKVGVGLGTAAIAGGIGYASLGPQGRSFVRAAVKNPRQFFRGAGGGSRRWSPPGFADGDILRTAQDLGLGRVKTKAEFAKSWKAAARKHHPDLGGDAEMMKAVNEAFEAFKRSSHYEKLAHLLLRRGSVSELGTIPRACWSAMANTLV